MYIYIGYNTVDSVSLLGVCLTKIWRFFCNQLTFQFADVPWISLIPQKNTVADFPGFRNPPGEWAWCVWEAADDLFASWRLLRDPARGSHKSTSGCFLGHGLFFCGVSLPAADEAFWLCSIPGLNAHTGICTIYWEVLRRFRRLNNTSQNRFAVAQDPMNTLYFVFPPAYFYRERILGQKTVWRRRKNKWTLDSKNALTLDFIKSSKKILPFLFPEAKS